MSDGPLPCFQSQLLSAPWGLGVGSSLHGSTGEDLDSGLACNSDCVCWMCLSLQHLSAKVLAPNLKLSSVCLSMVLYLYPSFARIPTVNSWHLTHTRSWSEQKNENKVNPKARLLTRVYRIQQKHIFVLQHTDHQLETLWCHLYLSCLASICSRTLPRRPPSDRERCTVKVMKRPQVQSCKNTAQKQMDCTDKRVK